MGGLLQLNREDTARLIALVRGAAERGSYTIKSAFRGEMMEGGVGFRATVLGVEYQVSIVGGSAKVLFTDPLGRDVDAHKILTYMLNALERVLSGKVPRQRGALVGISRLRGGSSAYLYEKRISSYLMVELDHSSIQEVERAVKAIGGYMRDHPSATWSFEINQLNGLRVAVAFWQGEEGIPSGASILFGEEAMDVDIPIEEIIVVTEIIVDRFVAFYRKESGRKPRLFSSLYL